MITLSKTNRAVSLQRLAALCVLMAAASAQAGYVDPREPPSGLNGWTPAVAANAKVMSTSIASVRALPKSGLVAANGWQSNNGLDGMNGLRDSNGLKDHNGVRNPISPMADALSALQQLARAPLAQ